MKDFIQRVAREAGELALAYRNRKSPLQMDRKVSDKDLVTEADRGVEAFIRREIGKAYPDHGITGEEQGSSGEHEYRWIIDPIDGTVSYYHGQHFFSVSIAVTLRDEIVLGAVCAPALNELFFAERGKGAYLNGREISVSSSGTLGDAVAATGLSCLIREGKNTDCLDLFGRMIPHLRDFRRGGSAALDLCSVACGRLDAYWERCLNIYDVAGGIIILEEAGGRVTDYGGNTDKMPGEICASNGILHKEMTNLLGR